MQELPDVVVFCRYFEATALDKTIETMEVANNRVLKTDPDQLQAILAGNAFRNAPQYGKYLFARLKKNENGLVLHFGMSGYLPLYENG